MDPLTHTLFGWALAEAGLKQRSALAAPALVIGANLPDVDVLAYLWGAPAALAFRRGWTHGVLAMLLLPPLLTALLVLWDRLVRRRARPGLAPASPRSLLVLSALAIGSHPTLDWLNNYGLRWLMPFDGRWFYGDALFIVDPWLWLLLGAAVWLGRADSGAARARFATLGLAMAVAILGTGVASPVARALWCAMLASLVGARLLGLLPGRRSRPRLAGAFLVLALAYVAAMVGSATAARRAGSAALDGAGIAGVERLMVAPMPATPWRKELVAAVPGGYRTGGFDWRREPRLTLDPLPIPRRPFPAAVAAAAATPAGRAFLLWARFPCFEIEESADGTVVYLIDARYARRRTAGFGGAVIRLDRELRPLGSAEKPGLPRRR